MELGKQIKKHRQEVQLSQEKLADRVYVSRQTISNWENDKSYPDVNSLVLLSEIFQISLDNLIKGDIEVMKDVIQKEEIVAFSEGKLLDDIQKQRGTGKRPYQKIFLVIGSALITFVVCVLIGFLMHIFMN